MSDSTSHPRDSYPANRQISEEYPVRPAGINADGLWRCLVAWGVERSIATEICAGWPRTLTDALDAASIRQPVPSNSQRSIWIDLADPIEDPEFRELTLMLASLPEASRRAVFATVIGGVPIERLTAEADADESDLEDGIGRLERDEPDRSIAELFAPVFDIRIPPFETPKAPTGPKWLAAGALATAGFVSILVWAPNKHGHNVQVPLELAAPTTMTMTITSPEPDREIEISITDDNTIIRREPWTRRVIWESRPFDEVEILSIDPNTVTITSRGYRLFVSLTDGTLLPP